jgi:hypothetical protein
LCGSAAVKKELREAFEKDSKTVGLCENQYPDINVITGKNMGIILCSVGYYSIGKNVEISVYNLRLICFCSEVLLSFIN